MKKNEEDDVCPACEDIEKLNKRIDALERVLAGKLHIKRRTEEDYVVEAKLKEVE